MKKIQIEGKDYSAIISGIPPKVFRSVEVTSLLNDPGWIINSEGRMENWNLEAVIEHEGVMAFYGPLIEGRPFKLKTLGSEDLYKIISILQILKDKSLDYNGFYSRSWLFLKDGRVLILPQKLMDFIRKSDNEASRKTQWYPYNHPDRTGKNGIDFTAAVLSLSFLANEHPYAPLEEEEDNRNEQLRRLPVLTPSLSVPGLKNEYEELLTLALKGKETKARDWTSFSDALLKGSLKDDLPPEEIRQIREKAAQIRSKGEKSHKRRQLWRRKNVMYISIALALVFTGIVISTPIRKAMEPPKTIGLSPREVVEAYYAAFNTLDQEIMEDSIEKSVGKGDLNEVTNFFVTSRVRMGYEGTDGTMTAQDWVDAGKPELEMGVNVYGIANIQITELGGAAFRVAFEKWYPGTSKEMDPSSMEVLPPEGFKLVDHIELQQQKKGNWLIISQDRVIEEISD